MTRHLFPLSFRFMLRRSPEMLALVNRIEARVERTEQSHREAVDMVASHREFLADLSDRTGVDHRAEFATFYLRSKGARDHV
jgi:hypothetical protein